MPPQGPQLRPHDLHRRYTRRIPAAVPHCRGPEGDGLDNQPRHPRRGSTGELAGPQPGGNPRRFTSAKHQSRRHPANMSARSRLTVRNALTCQGDIRRASRGLLSGSRRPGPGAECLPMPPLGDHLCNDAVVTECSRGHRVLLGEACSREPIASPRCSGPTGAARSSATPLPVPGPAATPRTPMGRDTLYRFKTALLRFVQHNHRRGISVGHSGQLATSCRTVGVAPSTLAAARASPRTGANFMRFSPYTARTGPFRRNLMPSPMFGTWVQ
jgi:hypothetical protein